MAVSFVEIKFKLVFFGDKRLLVLRLLLRGVADQRIVRRICSVAVQIVVQMVQMQMVMYGGGRDRSVVAEFDVGRRIAADRLSGRVALVAQQEAGRAVDHRRRAVVAMMSLGRWCDAQLQFGGRGALGQVRRIVEWHQVVAAGVRIYTAVQEAHQLIRVRRQAADCRLFIVVRAFDVRAPQVRRIFGATTVAQPGLVAQLTQLIVQLVQLILRALFGRDRNALINRVLQFGQPLSLFIFFQAPRKSEEHERYLKRIRRREWKGLIDCFAIKRAMGSGERRNCVWLICGRRTAKRDR